MRQRERKAAEEDGARRAQNSVGKQRVKSVGKQRVRGGGEWGGKEGGRKSRVVAKPVGPSPAEH